MMAIGGVNEAAAPNVSGQLCIVPCRSQTRWKGLTCCQPVFLHASVICSCCEKSAYQESTGEGDCPIPITLPPGCGLKLHVLQADLVQPGGKDVQVPYIPPNGRRVPRELLAADHLEAHVYS